MLISIYQKNHQIPVSLVKNKALYPVYYFEKIQKLFSRPGGSPLFALKNGKGKGNFAIHSLRRGGGATSLFNSKALPMLRIGVNGNQVVFSNI